jgi:hypothetical protein
VSMEALRRRRRRQAGGAEGVPPPLEPPPPMKDVEDDDDENNNNNDDPKHPHDDDAHVEKGVVSSPSQQQQQQQQSQSHNASLKLLEQLLRQEQRAWRVVDKLELEHRRKLLLAKVDPLLSLMGTSDSSDLHLRLHEKVEHDEQLRVCHDDIRRLQATVETLQHDKERLQKELDEANRRLVQERQQQPQQQPPPSMSSTTRDMDGREDAARTQDQWEALFFESVAAGARRIKELEDQLDHKNDGRASGEGDESRRRRLDRANHFDNDHDDEDDDAEFKVGGGLLELEKLIMPTNESSTRSRSMSSFHSGDARQIKDLEECAGLFFEAAQTGARRIEELEEQLENAREELRRAHQQQGMDDVSTTESNTSTTFFRGEDIVTAGCREEKQNRTTAARTTAVPIKNRHERTTRPKSRMGQKRLERKGENRTINRDPHSPAIKAVLSDEDSISSSSSYAMGDPLHFHMTTDLEKKVKSQRSELKRLKQELKEAHHRAQRAEDAIHTARAPRPEEDNQPQGESKAVVHDESEDGPWMMEIREKALNLNVLDRDPTVRHPLEQRVDELQEELNETRSTLEEAQRENVQLMAMKESMVGIHREMEDLVKSLEPIQLERIEQTNRANDAYLAKVAMKEELDRETAKRKEYAQRVEELEGRIQILQTEVTDEKRKLDKVFIELKNEQALRSEDAEAAQQEISSLNESLEKYKKKLEAEAPVKSLELIEQTNRANDAWLEKVAIKEELDRETARRKDYAHRIKRLQTRVLKLQADVAEKAEKLDEVLVSLLGEQALRYEEAETSRQEISSLKESLERYRTRLETEDPVESSERIHLELIEQTNRANDAWLEKVAIKEELNRETAKRHEYVQRVDVLESRIHSLEAEITERTEQLDLVLVELSNEQALRSEEAETSRQEISTLKESLERFRKKLETEDPAETSARIQLELIEQTNRANDAWLERAAIKEELNREIAKRQECEEQIEVLESRIQMLEADAQKRKEKLDKVYIALKIEQSLQAESQAEIKSLNESLDRYRTNLEAFQGVLKDASLKLRKSSIGPSNHGNNKAVAKTRR